MLDAAEKRRLTAIRRGLKRLYPDAHCALVYDGSRQDGPLQLLVATILSAQCTDERVNRVTPALFARYPRAVDFAGAPLEDLEQAIRSTGFFRNKARSIRDCCRALVAEHDGEVPANLDALVQLAGVGRKTANVVLGTAFGIPGLTVDTHVGRLSRRLGLSTHTDPLKVERDLAQRIPRREWTDFCHRMIWHGRRVCAARRPDCASCRLAPLCPAAFSEPGAGSVAAPASDALRRSARRESNRPRG